MPLSDGMRFFYPENPAVAGSGDLTGYTVIGPIKADVNGIVLATFTCSAPFYQQKVKDGVPVVANGSPVMGSYFTVRLPAVVKPTATGDDRYLPVPPNSHKLPVPLDSTTIDNQVAKGLYKLGKHFWTYSILAMPPNDAVDAIEIIAPSLMQVIGR
jgi:hypothetical protein